LAAGGPADQRVFAAEIGRRMGQPDYRPQRSSAPIAQWMEQTCWRPPSQPSVHFRMERTFGGPSYRKPDQRGIDSTAERAQQFAADRNRVSSMIYHRALAVIRSDVREHQRETRTAKLHGRPLASTTADSATVEEDLLALAGEEFERPGPAPSPFWDTAIEPIPWPARPRQTARSRPGPWPTSAAKLQQSAH
jgi:hypothetical protein